MNVLKIKGIEKRLQTKKAEDKPEHIASFIIYNWHNSFLPFCALWHPEQKTSVCACVLQKKDLDSCWKEPWATYADLLTYQNEDAEMHSGTEFSPQGCEQNQKPTLVWQLQRHNLSAAAFRCPCRVTGRGDTCPWKLSSQEAERM